MFKGLIDKVYDTVTLYAPTRGITLILGLGMLCWGIWVGLPFVSFNVPAYAIMAKLATESIWAAMFVYGGFSVLLGTFTKDIEWIRRGTFVGFLLWMIVAILGCIADPTATAVVTRSVIAFMHAWVYVQVKLHPKLITGEITIGDLEDFDRNKMEDNHGRNK